MTTPLCTVVIPCHDGEAYLEAAFQSVMNQTFRAFHLVIVDDASQDGTLALARRLAHGHNNVTVVDLPQNQGRCYARNVGTRINRSPFVSFLDQDDSYHPEFLQTTIQTLHSHSEIDAVRVMPNVSVDVHPVQYKSISDSLANTMVFRRKAFEFAGGWP
ncbi:MAG: glycosyltransferase family 2 protein, partial [Planctomycetaceae bacterium]|nr:glycosyltransferase family 2 protein [Planctomycetaceae bacterium]